MEKIITLVIPTYNMEKYLNKCLTSLIMDDNELMKLIEVLVVIDGAKDRSSEIAHTYQDKYPDTYRVIDKENGNYGSCVNRGLKEAKGKYIKILDADDSFDTSEFAKYLRRLCNVDVDMVLTPFFYVNEQGNKTHFVKYQLRDSDNLTFNDVTPALLSQSIQMHATTYRTESVRSIGYIQTEGISYTDQEWVFTPLAAVNKIAYFSNPIYLYLIGREGQTMNPEAIKRNIAHNVKCAQKILTDYVSFPNYGGAKQAIIDYKAMQTLEGPYYSYLFKYRDLNQDDLKEYDEFIKKLNSGLYSKTDDFKLRNTSYSYIQKWHKNKNVSIPRFYLLQSILIENYWKRFVKRLLSYNFLQM